MIAGAVIIGLVFSESIHSHGYYQLKGIRLMMGHIIDNILNHVEPKVLVL